MAYMEDIGDNRNSLALYDGFLANLGLGNNLEGLIRETLQTQAVCRVLDIGAGNAGALTELKKKFGQRVQVIGLDLFAPSGPVDEFLVGDANSLEWPKDCNLVISFRAMHEMGRTEHLLRKTAATLAPGGLAVLSIRAQYEAKNAIFPQGKLHEEDLDFLRRFEEQNQWRGRQVLVTAFIEKTRPPTTPAEFVSGYLVLLRNETE